MCRKQLSGNNSEPPNRGISTKGWWYYAFATMNEIGRKPSVKPAVSGALDVGRPRWRRGVSNAAP
jgi:hypothetical protein